MALCGKVYDRVDIVIRHNPCDQIRIANIALDKVNTLGLLQRLKAQTVTRIGQRIQHYDRVVRVCFDPVVDKVRADEPRPARDHH